MTDPTPARVAADRGRTERREADETARRRAQEPAVAGETVPPVPAPTPDGQTGTQGREERRAAEWCNRAEGLLLAAESLERQLNYQGADCDALSLVAGVVVDCRELYNRMAGASS